MIRLIVRVDEAGMAANVGGSVLTTFHTFDVDLPGVEAVLTAKRDRYAHAQLVGAQIVPSPTPQDERA